MGGYRNFLNVEIIGKKTNDEIKVVSKLINRSNPIEEVPWWDEINKVPNEHIVVKELVKIAKGVFELKTLDKSPSSDNLVIKYIG